MYNKPSIEITFIPSLRQIFSDHLIKVSEVGGDLHKNWISEFINKDDMFEPIIKIALEKMEMCFRNRKGHSAVFTEKNVLYMIECIPVNVLKAPSWFTNEYGGYLWLQDSVTKNPVFVAMGAKVFCHIMFGIEDMDTMNNRIAPWAALSILPVWDLNQEIWLYSRSCLRKDEREALGML